MTADRSKNRSTGRPLSTRIDCPWDTIKMVPTPSVQGHATSLESQPNFVHPIFSSLKLLDEERVRKPLEQKLPS